MPDEIFQIRPIGCDGQAPLSRGPATVELILDKLVAWETIEQLLEAHPRPTHEAIKAAPAFASKAIKADVVYPLKSTG